MFNPSCIQRFNYSKFENFHVDILRDDLIHPVVCGNKWRKLKYVIEEIKSQNIKKVLTFGGAYSNHLVAVAEVCNFLNIEAFAFLRGNEERPENHYEKYCAEKGMKLMKVSREDFKNKEKLIRDFSIQHFDFFTIPEGGNHELALKGCSEILDELSLEYDYIISSLGTGTTMEGLVKGVIERKIKTKVLGISSLKNNFELDQRLEKYPKDYYEVFHHYHRGKYGKIDDELICEIKEVSKETGILLEPIYTGKMILALKDLMNKKYFKEKDKILFIHSGGLMYHRS